MVRKNAGPTMDDVLEFLTSPRVTSERFGSSPAAVFRAYQQRAMADPEIRAQLAAEFGSLPGPVRQAVSGSTAVQALYDPSAPGAGLNGRVGSLGEFAAAARSKEGRARLAGIENSYSSEVPADGGFLVPEEIRSDFVLASLESAIIRPRATVVPSSTGRLRMPMVDDTTHASGTVFGGFSFGWTEEGQALPASTAAFANEVLDAKKLTAYSAGVPNELVGDAPALGVFLRSVVPQGMAFAEDAAFIAGTGVGEPMGLLSAPCQVQVTRATSSRVQLADIIAMVTRVLPASMARFIWLCSPDVLIQLLEVFYNFGSATTGIVPPPRWLKFSELLGCWTLLGRPLFSTEHVPALGAQGDLVAVDPAFVVIADRQLLQLAASALGSGFAADKTEFRFTARLDSRVWLHNPLTPANSSATVSPVVVLK